MRIELRLMKVWVKFEFGIVMNGELKLVVIVLVSIVLLVFGVLRKSRLCLCLLFECLKCLFDC